MTAPATLNKFANPRTSGIFLQPLERARTVQFGHHRVEQDQVGPLPLGDLQPLRPAGRKENLEAADHLEAHLRDRANIVWKPSQPEPAKNLFDHAAILPRSPRLVHDRGMFKRRVGLAADSPVPLATGRRRRLQLGTG